MVPSFLLPHSSSAFLCIESDSEPSWHQCTDQCPCRYRRNIDISELGNLLSRERRHLGAALGHPVVSWTDPVESFEEDKRHLAAALNAVGNKRHIGAALNAGQDKRHLGSALSVGQQDKRHLGAALNVGAAWKHVGAAHNAGDEKRHLGAALNAAQTKRHLGAALSVAQDKRHLGAALNVGRGRGGAVYRPDDK